MRRKVNLFLINYLTKDLESGRNEDDDLEAEN